MALFIVIPVHLLVSGYILVHLYRWTKACTSSFSKKVIPCIVAALYIFFTLAFAIAALLPAGGAVQRFFKILSNYWLGILLYSGIFVVLCDLVHLIVWLVKKKSPFKNRKVFVITGTVGILLVATICTMGYFHSRDILIKPYSITVDKEAGDLKSLKVALIADTHLGYNIGYEQMVQMVEKINGENVDIVLFAGDIFDNEYESIYEPDRIADELTKLKSTYGTYACWGNHDVDEVLVDGFTVAGEADKNDTKYLEFLKRANINILQDQSILIDDAFYVVGRRDMSRSARMEETRLTPAQLTADLDKTKPIFVIDHQPRQYEELEAAGVDVDFSGHTHDGQLFPGNLITSLAYENSHGYWHKGSMQAFTTSGVGLWGPDMRVGTDSEIMIIDITFK